MIATASGYSRPHTVHCGPEGIYVSALGSPGGDGPGGIFLLDHFTFDVLDKWEVDRGDQYLHYDFWWHLLHDTLISSEWATPKMIENGLQPDLLMQFGVRPSAARLGSAPTQDRSRASTWGRNTKWSWKCARPTIRVRPMGLSGS